MPHRLFAFHIIHLQCYAVTTECIYKPSTALGTWDAAQNKTEESCPHGAITDHMNKTFSILGGDKAVRGDGSG